MFIYLFYFSRYLLTSPAGRGKSAALAYAVHRARSSGGLAVFVRDAYDWTHTQVFVPRCPTRPGFFRLPDVEYDFLDFLRDGNGTVLATLKPKTDKAKQRGDRTLLDTVSRAVAELDEALNLEKLASQSALIDTVFEELALVTEVPVLLAIDEYNHLFSNTKYVDADTNKCVRWDQLKIVQQVQELVRTIKRGTTIAALSHSPLPLPRELPHFAQENGYLLKRVKVDVEPEEMDVLAAVWQAQGTLGYVPRSSILNVIYNQTQRDMRKMRDRIDAYVMASVQAHLPHPFITPPQAKQE